MLGSLPEPHPSHWADKETDSEKGPEEPGPNITQEREQEVGLAVTSPGLQGEPSSLTEPRLGEFVVSPHASLA